MKLAYTEGMGHKLRLFQSKYPYHVFNRTNNKEFLFDPRRDFGIFMTCLRLVSLRTGFRPHHFILMTNHYHLMGSTPESNLDKVMHLLQILVSKSINQELNRINHIFGSRYGATVVASEAYQSTLIHYLYHNAPKENLVKQPVDYPYSTLRFYLDGTWQEQGLFWDPYLEGLSVAERIDYLINLNNAHMRSDVFEDFGKTLRKKFIL